ncbi:MAG: hypothetical protein IT584_01520 [Chlamydiae bacterium]|nr:hypothetical protein [Chlamydiota bacterium]
MGQKKRASKTVLYGYEFKTIAPPFAIHLGPVCFQSVATKAPSFKKLDDSQLLGLLQETNPSIWRRIFRW